MKKTLAPLAISALLALTPAFAFAQYSGGCVAVGDPCNVQTSGDGVCTQSDEGGVYCKPKALNSPTGTVQTSPTGTTKPTGTVSPTSGSQGGINKSYIQGYANSIIDIINTILVPLLTAVAFIVFLWGVYLYYIKGGAEPEKRKIGHSYMMWAIIGFVILFTLWAIVQLVTSTLGLQSGGDASTRGLKLPTIDKTP
jgi:hypothetical protein